MSDFDREAERERLREQFEADKQKREQSERMSELLLKGATMTNKHCDRCGDPVFRWDGQEFCPTCQGGPSGEPTETAGDAAGNAADADPAAEADAAEPRSPPANGQPADADPSSAISDEDATPVPEGADEEPATAPSAGRQPEASAPTSSNTAPDSTPRPATGPTEATGPDATSRDNVAAARASLARTLASLSARAESADDLSSKREYLAAAQEAAEALDAAETAGR